MSQPADPHARLGELERRIRRIEARLGIESEEVPARPSAPYSVERGVALIGRSITPVPQPVPPEPPRPPISPPIAPPPAPVRPKQTARVAIPPKLHREPLDLERMIGTRWFAAAGAVIVVIGVGLFLKLAYDRGWMNQIPPAAKCLSGAGFGAALLIAGEFIRRRIGSLASAGLSAAGLGALFAAAYAAYGVYHLIPAPAAFAFLAVIAALGFGVAAVGRLVSVAVLSLVAAYVNPIIVGGDADAPLVLPAYLFALLCLGLALSAWRPVPFRILRGLVWWGTVLFGTAWALEPGLLHPGAALTFLVLCWSAVHAELTLSARWPRTVPPEGLVLEIPWPSVRFIATSFSTTAWVVTLGVYVLRRAATVGDWAAPAVAAGAAALLAGALAGRLRVLRDVPRTDPERLGAGLAMQAGALVMTALALGLSGWMEAVAWLSLGVSAVGAGRWIRSRGLDVYGLVALAIASGRLIVIDSPLGTSPVLVASFAGLLVTRWTLLMVSGAAAWGVASLLLRPDTGTKAAIGRIPWGFVRRGVVIVAMCHLNASPLNPGADAGSVAAAWLALGLLGFAMARALTSPGLAAYGGATLALASLRFLVMSPFAADAERDGVAVAGLVLGRWAGLMLAAAAAWMIAALFAPPRTGPNGRATPWRGLSMGALVTGLSFVSLSLAHPDADAGAVCLAWLTLGIIGIGLSRHLKSPGLLGYGLVMLAAASGRFLWGAPITGAKIPVLAAGAGLVVTRWTLLMLGGALAWFVAAALSREGKAATPDGPLLSPERTPLVGVGLAMLYIAALDARADAGSVSMAWLGVGAIAALAHPVFKRVGLDLGGLAGVALALVAWAVAYPLDWMTSKAPLTMHPGLWSSIAIAAVAIAMRAWLRRSARRSAAARLSAPEVLRAVVPTAIALLFASTSLEVARISGAIASDPAARKAAVSIWWGLVGVGFVVTGFLRRSGIVRRIGLALMSIATAKALLFDLATVPQGWRVASFVGLGLLMLAVAVGYAKAAAILVEPERSKPAPPPSPAQG